MFEVRRARQNDVGELARLSSQLGYPVSDDVLAENLAILDNDGDHAVFVLEKEAKRLAGFGHVFLTRRLFLPQFAELGGLVVDEKSRREGLGAILLESAENWALERGAPEMRVRSNVLREKARGFYLGQKYHDSKKQTVFIKSITR